MHEKLSLIAVTVVFALSPAAPTRAYPQGAATSELAASERPSQLLAEPNPDSAKQPGLKSPKDRDGQLEELYAQLADAPDPASARALEKSIEKIWLQTDSDTIGVLMARALKAIAEKRTELALRLLDAVVELAPDYAEGWNRRAYVYYLQDRSGSALGDLRRVLALEPKHFGALYGLARILNDYGQKKNALKAYQELLRINPHTSGAKEAVDKLSVEVEGQGI